MIGAPYKKENCYENISVVEDTWWLSNLCHVNSKFIALVVVESEVGGSFLVAPLEKVWTCISIT